MTVSWRRSAASGFWGSVLIGAITGWAAEIGWGANSLIARKICGDRQVRR
jgi:hypothetical protein